MFRARLDLAVLYAVAVDAVGLAIVDNPLDALSLVEAMKRRFGQANQQNRNTARDG